MANINFIVKNNIELKGNLIFEGATKDAFETTLAITDPTADRTITFPNSTGTVALTSDIPTDTNYYPTAVTMTAGGPSGPTVNLTMSGVGNITGAAIPSASASASGIVTTGIQKFSGSKTFDELYITTGNNNIRIDPFYNVIYANNTNNVGATLYLGTLGDIVSHVSIPSNLNVDGQIDTTTSTNSLWNTNVTTLTAFGAATTLSIGHTSTATKTLNLFAGATISGATKTLNIGTGGASGSTTNINIGSSATGTTTINNNLSLSGAVSIAASKNIAVASYYSTTFGTGRVVMTGTGSNPATRPDGTSLVAGDIWIAY